MNATADFFSALHCGGASGAFNGIALEQRMNVT